MNKFFYIVCAGLMLSACSEEKITLNGHHYTHTAPNGTVISLDFMPDETRVAGAVVNRYFGTYELNQNQIKFGPMGTTMMMGPRDEMKVESDYLQFLNQVNQFSVTKTTLTLKTPDGQEMTFNKQN